ncbi:DUF1642 domain-containing protein [Enterococcus durans]|uniref:DUF1642 domain-containing protein n=1 Tax=Enterococcus durans TaxID=53345 RepID=UPI0039A65ADC
MNKQELIDKYTAEISRLRPYCPNRHLISKQLKYDLYKEILEDLKQLDEPKKPVVPKFVAEWIEYAKKKGDSLAISFKPWKPYGVDYSKADRWIGDNQETFARAWIDGYEVEKELLYSVIIAGEYLVKEISCSNEVKLVSTAYLPQYLAHHYQLTEKQIKAIDERYWPFAVPVEEGAEG